MSKAKPFNISKQVVFKAYQRVKANRGSAGIDHQSIKEFELKLEDNLYKVWNRMSSGSYFPKPVLRVEIPKPDGRLRPLGIPTISDRIAQMVVKIEWEPELEKYFHEDSYGYRPDKSAQQAIEVTRKRCWQYDWIVDLDIKGFFDNIDHSLLMKAVRKHTEENWILLYIERWLKTPVQLSDGTIEESVKGTPQGGVISPLLANLFLHYAFDAWMGRSYPTNPFERYADDVVVHCRTQVEAEHLKAAISDRLKECKLELNPEKTKIVYCKDDNRKGDSTHTQFDFLGFTFRSRSAKGRGGKLFNSFSPAVSKKARKAFSDKMRAWKIYRQSQLTIFDISRMFNPKLRGWMNYFGCFNRSATYPVLMQFNAILYRWGRRKYKRLKTRRKFFRWLKRMIEFYPYLFIHWKMGGLGARVVQ